MVTLKLKAPDVRIVDGRERNDGGRDLTADESPTGEPITAPAVFQAPDEWYRQRRHWHFLVPIEHVEVDEREPHTIDEPPRSVNLPDPVVSPIFTEADASTVDLETLSYRDLQTMAKDLGIPANGSADALRARIAEHDG